MYRDATEDDLKPLRDAAEQFRRLWQGLPGTSAPLEFRGSPGDVNALDYLEYEGIAFPSCGMEGAAMIWGEVVGLLDFKWVVNDRGEFLLATKVEDEPQKMIFPWARVIELRYFRYGGGNFGHAVAKVIVDYLISMPTHGNKLWKHKREWLVSLLKAEYSLNLDNLREFLKEFE